jgi:hypothetical protein
MSPPPPEQPTPSTLGAVDLDPWIPKPSTRDIVDHLVQEINAAKQIAEEITAVQVVLDGMMEGGDVGVERVQRMLEEKSARVEELEGMLGVEREARRVLEERVKVMEDERAEKLLRNVGKEDILEESVAETLVAKEDGGKEEIKDDVTALAIPDVDASEPTKSPSSAPSEPVTYILSPPTSPSTAPSSPITDTRSISPISFPSTESSHPDPTPLIEKITHLESLLATARSEIAEFKSRVPSIPIVGATTAAVTSVDFPFTFSAPTSPSPSRRNGSLRLPSSPGRSLRRRKSGHHDADDINTNGTTGKEMANGTKGKEVANGTTRKEGGVTAEEKGDRDLLEGLCAAVGVVVLGWMGMWLVNHLVERGEKLVK